MATPEYEDDETGEEGGDSLPSNGAKATLTPYQATEKQKINAAKFFTLSADIQTTFFNIEELQNEPREQLGGKIYLCFNKEKNRKWKLETRNLRQYIAEGEFLFDSDIHLDKFAPSWGQYKHIMFFLIDECTTKHSQRPFFIFWEKQNQYKYNFTDIDLGIGKLAYALGELLGGLKQAGNYILNETLECSSSTPSGSTGTLAYGGYGGGYAGYNPGVAYPITNDWQNPALQEQPKLRDVGDAHDGIR